MNSDDQQSCESHDTGDGCHITSSLFGEEFQTCPLCIQAATKEVSIEINNLPKHIRWGLGRKSRFVNLGALCGVLEVKEDAVLQVLFEYRLELDSSGRPTRHHDGRPIIKITSIQRAVRTKHWFEVIHIMYVLLALLGMLIAILT